jgi:nicotinate-nucleotide adenylyltransferase
MQLPRTLAVAGNCPAAFPMNVAIFGGTFDPVHRGHLAVARAAQSAHKLGRIYFVPADIPPHKQRQPITSFHHRYAMLALALRGEAKFVPSLMEDSRQLPVASRQRPNYSIDTVRRFRALLGERDRLFFIIGIDAFLDIGTWYKPQELMREVEFIVVSRPGFDFKNAPQRTQRETESRIHWLDGVSENVSSTKVREAVASRRYSKRLLDEAVVEYIRKEHLYQSST